MTNEELLREINSLSSESRKIVEEFVAFIRNRKSDNAEARTELMRPLREEPFFGMWAGREDMKDSVEWVRKIRREHWSPDRRTDR